MTVDAHHLNLFPSQLQPNRDMMMMNTTDTNYTNMYNNYSSLLPLSGTTTVSENLIPSQSPSNNPFITDYLRQKTTPVKPDTIFAYNNNNNVVSFPQKRSRDSINNYPFINEDFSQYIHHQNTDIDNFISQHTEKFRVELEEKRKRETMMIIEAIENEVMKKMKAKEEEIQKMERMNMILEDKVKTLCMENQIWRELAQNNEATANALRNNLQQILMQQIENNNDNGDGEYSGGGDFAVAGAAAVAEDVESCCSNDEYSGWRRVVMAAQDKDEGTSSGGVMNNRLCRNCGEGESCVLIMPCRHLCLCSMCGAMVLTCPICDSVKSATLNVNLD